ncbi:hypothetical protein GPALN_003682 [Globodera pallida]|uniref:Proteasome subunit alpha type n=1 Tax=Globodera pallida TaxID=36090 RepID=A0A183BWQ6_GLOPA|nr:hypothetical protein GPALN_003682 [Globodera pallida]
MFRNQYDSDVTVFSPQGRLHQIDYAIEAMRQGSAAVAIRSKDCAVVVALMRAQNELSSYQQKVFKLDDHLGLSMSGLISDGRILARFMQGECAEFRWNYHSPISIELLNRKLGLKLQSNTQYYGRRPFGVGLLIVGYDDKGPHVVKAEPSGDVAEMYAAAIGARSQSARTYLEKKLQEFDGADKDALIRHAIRSLKETLQADAGSLDENNTSIAIIGLEQPFTFLGKDATRMHIRFVEEQAQEDIAVE